MLFKFNWKCARMAPIRLQSCALLQLVSNFQRKRERVFDIEKHKNKIRHTQKKTYNASRIDKLYNISFATSAEYVLTHNILTYKNAHKCMTSVMCPAIAGSCLKSIRFRIYSSFYRWTVILLLDKKRSTQLTYILWYSLLCFSNQMNSRAQQIQTMKHIIYISHIRDWKKNIYL